MRQESQHRLANPSSDLSKGFGVRGESIDDDGDDDRDDDDGIMPPLEDCSHAEEKGAAGGGGGPLGTGGGGGAPRARPNTSWKRGTLRTTASSEDGLSCWLGRQEGRRPLRRREMEIDESLGLQIREA